jgi:hypothetical protein
METLIHAEVYRKREKQTLEALDSLAAELETCGHYDLALDCQESITAVRNGNLAMALSLLGRVEASSELASTWCAAREAASSQLCGLQTHLCGEAVNETDWS